MVDPIHNYILIIIKYNLLACTGPTMYFSSILSASVFSPIRRRAPTTSLHEALGVCRSHREMVSCFHPSWPSVGWLLSIRSNSQCCTPRQSPSIRQAGTPANSLQRVTVSGLPAVGNVAVRLLRNTCVFSDFSQYRYCQSTNTNVFTIQHTNSYIQTPLPFNTACSGSPQ